MNRSVCCKMQMCAHVRVVNSLRARRILDEFASTVGSVSVRGKE